MKGGAILLSVLSLLLFAFAAAELVPRATLDAAPYAEWAHHHWVWLSAKESNRESVEELIEGYKSRNIRVGAVDLDSGWSTCYNNFEFDEHKYPNTSEMISNFHSNSIRVILWATSMINDNCDIYEEARNKSYFVRNAMDEQMKPIKWWHGHGCLIDYTNPDALNWWHSKLDQALDLGIDGWKTDGSDPFIMELGYARGAFGRHISYRDYADAYYGDFLHYSRKRLGQDRLIMSRPVDSVGPVFMSFSPPDVMFSGWVGDLDPSWDGYKIGLERMRASAKRNYLNFGTDIGGYRSCGGSTCREQTLFMRWFQLGAFTPLMENGGDDNHQPWLFDEHDNPGSNLTVDTYREYVETHYALLPYFLSTGTRRFAEQKSSMEFLSIWRDDFSYLLGDDILVVPPLSNSSSVAINFPKGSDWQCWWNHTYSFKGGEKIHSDYPINRFPVFQRANTIVALYDTNCKQLEDNVVARIAVTNLAALVHSFPIIEQKPGGLVVSVSASSPSSISLSTSAHDSKSVTFSLRLSPDVPLPKNVVTHDGVAFQQRTIAVDECSGATDGLWWGVRSDRIVYVHLPPSDNGGIAIVNF